MLAALALAAAPPLLVVRAASTVRVGGELAGRLVCFIIGTRAEDALNAWAAANHVDIERLPFQEPDEMADAFAVGKCAAAAVEEGELPAGARVVANLPETPILATGSPSSRP